VQRYENIYLSKYYSSIKELPMVNWIELHNTSDLSKLSRTGKICKRAISVYEKLRDEVIDTFGASPEYLKLHRAQIELELLQCELLHTGDRSLQFHIEMEERNVVLMLKPQEKQDIYQAFVWIKKQGINISEDQVSVFWFFKYMDFLVKELKPKPVANVRK
jgi:hypothetical protein